MLSLIEQELNARKRFLEEIEENFQNYIYTVCIMLQETFNSGGKVILFGDDKNSDMVKMFADELIVKFSDSKLRLPAVVLQSSKSVIEVSSVDEVFERQLGVLANSTDMVIGVSVDGYNKSILRALSLGKNLGCRTVGLSGEGSNVMEDFCDINISVPEMNNLMIREFFIILGDIISSVAKVKTENL